MSQETRNGGSSDRRQRTDQEQAPQSAERGQPSAQERDGVNTATGWLANTAVRTGLTLVGVVVLLFALGQAVGLPLLELSTDAVTSQTGRWLVVAFFAVLLIGAAQKARPIG